MQEEITQRDLIDFFVTRLLDAAYFECLIIRDGKNEPRQVNLDEAKADAKATLSILIGPFEPDTSPIYDKIKETR